MNIRNVLVCAVAIFTIGNQEASGQIIPTRPDVNKTTRVISETPYTVLGGTIVTKTEQTDADTASYKLFGQGGVSFSDAKPRVNVEVAKYWMDWGTKDRIPITLLTKVPIAAAADAESYRNEISNERGGIANISIGREETRTDLWGLIEYDDSKSDEMGIFYGYRALGKFLDHTGKGESAKYSAFLGGSFQAAYRARLYKGKNSDKSSEAGYFRLQGSTTLQWGEDETFLELSDGDKWLWYTNINVALLVFENFGVTAGWTVNASSQGFDDRFVVVTSILR